MFYPLQALNMNMLKVKGRGDYMLTAELIKKTMGITCVLILINFDLKWVVIGWTCCSIIEFLISEFFFLKLCHFSLYGSIRVFVPAVMVTFVLSFILSIITDFLFEDNFMRFIVGVFCFAGVYGLINLRNVKNLI